MLMQNGDSGIMSKKEETRMKKTLMAIALGAACIAGSNGIMADNENQWEGRINVTAPACNNNPWVRFKENRYDETCSKNYEFMHLREGTEKLVKWHYDDEGIWPLQMETWLDRNADGTADQWNMYLIDVSSPTYSRLIETRTPPSEEDQQNYENTLTDIGTEEVKSEWETWRTRE